MKWAAPLTVERPRLTGTPAGRTYVVTGAGSGLGHAAARALVRGGGRVLLLARDPESVAQVRASIAPTPGSPQVQAHHADLTNPESIEAFAAWVAEEEGTLHGILHCAGVLLPERETSPSGLEVMFGTEILGPYLLTIRLMEELQRTDALRVVFVTGRPLRVPMLGGPKRLDTGNLQGERSFHPIAHAQHLMLAKILLARELGRRVREQGVGTVVVAPGTIRSGYLRHCPLHLRLLARSLLTPGRKSLPEAAGAELLHAVVDPDLEGTVGQYLLGKQETVPPPPARDRQGALALWKVCRKLTGVGVPEQAE